MNSRAFTSRILVALMCAAVPLLLTSFVYFGSSASIIPSFFYPTAVVFVIVGAVVIAVVGAVIFAIEGAVCVRLSMPLTASFMFSRFSVAVIRDSVMDILCIVDSGTLNYDHKSFLWLAHCHTHRDVHRLRTKTHTQMTQIVGSNIEQ